MSQQILKSERTRRILLHRSGGTNSAQRRARTRSLIQLGGLIEKAGLLETFGIELGLDLQKDLTMKEPIAALFKGLLDLNESAQTDHAHFALWSQEGLQELSARSQKSEKEI